MRHRIAQVRWFLGVMMVVLASRMLGQNESASIEQYQGAAAERVEAAVQAWSGKLGAIRTPGTLNQRDTPRGQFAGVSEGYAKDPGHMHAFVAIGAGTAVCHAQILVSPQSKADSQAALHRCGELLGSSSASSGTAGNSMDRGGVRPHTAGGATTREAPVASASAPPAHADNWSRVKGVYFKSTSESGVGGMVVMTFEPIIFFNDGSTFEIGRAALEDIDLVAERQQRPRNWGRFEASGSRFTLFDDKGRADTVKLQDGRLFVAIAAEKGGPLSGRYEHLGGGGDSAIGGSLAIMSQSQITFTRDGQFGSGSQSVVSGPSVGGGGGRTMRAPGTYKVSRYTLEAHYPDGHSERTFFAYSSQGADGALDRKMVFIGDTPYTLSTSR